MRTSGLVTFSLLLTVLMGINGESAHAGFAKFGTTLASNHPSVVALSEFQKNSKGQSFADTDQMTIQIFADAQLGDENELLKGLQFGHIEMGILPLPLLTSHSPLLSALTMPYLFKNDDHQFRVLDGPLGQKLLSTLEEANLVGLGFLQTGARHIITSQEIDDFQGININIICPAYDKSCHTLPAQLSIRSFETVGAIVAPFDTSKTVEQLERQTIQALECSALTAQELRVHHRNLQIMTLSAHTAIPDVIVASKRWFDTLSIEVQNHLRKVSRATVTYQRHLWAIAEQEACATLKSEGMQVEIPDRSELRRGVRPLYATVKSTLGEQFTYILESIVAVH
ncbi:MAG: TRAP transporter substrate-binding protein DctP [Candidatus Vecturithrix sp.]|jgi:TRAP-type C4-dicarboxylate transport system substrate-binding protein|nr:TRAP transporter substrate-binding protein DctP [Candidatus Vecturithrix sp.]